VAQVGFRSLTEAIDTTTPAGRMMMQMVGDFAEFERAMLQERTRAGLEQAKKEGRVGGRRRKLSDHQQAEILRMLMMEAAVSRIRCRHSCLLWPSLLKSDSERLSKGEKTAADAARLFKIHPATVSRLLRRHYAK
jgi:hypothetical protein